MRLRRSVLTIALAALPVVVTATPINAAGCPLVADATGDTALVHGVPLPVPQIDIVSADVASGPATVAVALRVASLDPDPLGNLDPIWSVFWDIDDKSYAVELWFGAGPLGRGYVPEFRINGQAVGPVPFTFDVVDDTITWTVPRGLLPDLAAPGATFTGFRAFTNLLGGFLSTDTAANASATYVDQTAGCIPAA